MPREYVFFPRSVYLTTSLLEPVTVREARLAVAALLSRKDFSMRDSGGREKLAVTLGDGGATLSYYGYSVAVYEWDREVVHLPGLFVWVRNTATGGSSNLAGYVMEVYDALVGEGSEYFPSLSDFTVIRKTYGDVHAAFYRHKDYSYMAMAGVADVFIVLDDTEASYADVFAYPDPGYAERLARRGRIELYRDTCPRELAERLAAFPCNSNPFCTTCLATTVPCDAYLCRTSSKCLGAVLGHGDSVPVYVAVERGELDAYFMGVGSGPLTSLVLVVRELVYETIRCSDRLAPVLLEYLENPRTRP